MEKNKAEELPIGAVVSEDHFSYVVVPVDGADGNITGGIKVLDGPCAGLIFSYHDMKFDPIDEDVVDKEGNTETVVNFSYVIHQPIDNMKLLESDEFTTHTGLILTDIIKKYAETVIEDHEGKGKPRTTDTSESSN